MTQIIDSVIYPEGPRYAEDSEEGNVTVQIKKKFLEYCSKNLFKP